MEKHFARAAWGLVVCAVCVAVIVAFAPMYFTHPLADDFARWHASTQDGWLHVVRFNYSQWTGRWCSVALEAGLLPWLRGHRYGAALAGLTSTQLVACYAFVRLVLGQCTSRLASGGLAVCLFALSWAGMPAPGETVYWVTGGIEYQLSISLAIVVIWLARARPAAIALRWALAGGLSLLTLLVTGLHELVAVMLVIVLALAAVISFRLRRDRLPLWCCLLAIAGIGLFVSVLAPGNAARATHFPDARNPLKTVGHMLKFFLRDVPTWIADPKLLSATLFLFLSPWFARLRPDWLAWPAIPWSRIIPSAGVAFIAIGVAAPAFATGVSPPGRLENQLHFVFLMTWFTTLLLVTRWPEQNWILRRESPAGLLQTAALASLGLALLTTGNTSVGLRDFDKRLSRWHAAIVKREQLAGAAAAGSHLVLPEEPPRPGLFFPDDIGTDPGHWRNQLYAQFYGLASVRLDRQTADNRWDSPGMKAYMDPPAGGPLKKD